MQWANVKYFFFCSFRSILEWSNNFYCLGVWNLRIWICGRVFLLFSTFVCFASVLFEGEYKIKLYVLYLLIFSTPKIIILILNKTIYFINKRCLCFLSFEKSCDFRRYAAGTEKMHLLIGFFFNRNQYTSLFQRI